MLEVLRLREELI